MGRTSKGETNHRQGNRKIASLGLAAWVLLVPIALVSLGIWQTQRAAETLERSRRSSVELSTTLAQVKEIAASNPNAILTFQGAGEPTSLSALVAISQIQDALSQADEELEISQIRRPLVWGTIGGAVLAFLGGALGLMAASISGIRAQASQRQLIKSFQRLRSLLPFILATVVIGFSIGVISATLFEAISMGLWADFTTGSAKLFAVAIVLAVIAAYSAFMALRGLKDVFALFTPEPLVASGRVVEETEAPELWSFVRRLAGRQKALLPDTIIVGLDQGFFVTESQVRLWPENRLVTGRSLYLPAPYLDLLDAAEIAAVIGHELAHFSGEDTTYSQQFTPIYAGLWRALTALGRADGGRFVLYPAVKLGFHAIERFDHAVGHWSRLREFDADRNGSLLATPAGAASALIRTGIIAPAVAHILQRVYAESDDTASDDARPDLVAQTTELVTTHGWSDPMPLLEDRQPHPTDSHPPTIQRISALGVEIGDDLLRRATRQPEPGIRSSADYLFSDWAGLCRLLSRDFIDNARVMRDRRREALEKVVAGVSQETVVYDNVKPMIWTMAIVAMIFAGFGLTVVFLGSQLGLGYDQFAQSVVGAITAAGAIASLLYAAFLYRGAARPLMVLTPDGLFASRLDRPIAWRNVAGYAVYASSRFALRLWLDEDAPLPKKDWRAIYSKIDRRQRIVTLGAMGIKGMKPADFSALVGRYHEAAYAREELATTMSRPSRDASAEENVAR